MPTSSLVRFAVGTAAQYALLETKDQNTLYFITDERRIYKGDTVFSGGIFRAVSAYPETGQAQINTIYVNTTDGSAQFFNGTSYVQIVKPTSTVISGAGDDLHFATTKAIVDYVTQCIADQDLSAITDRLDTVEGQITVINGEGEGSIKKALSDAKSYADGLAAEKADLEHDHTLADITDAGTLAGKSQVSEAELEAALAAKINGKVDTTTLTSNYYDKGATDNAIATAVANAEHLKREIVEVLPDAGEADEHTIYMVGTGAGEEDSAYEEYMLINGAFELIGTSQVDLSGYATETFVTGKIAELDFADTAVTNQYVTEVDQTDGKISVRRATLPVYSVTESATNGKISVNGADVAVHGLGSAAYTEASAYATAAQGALADSAVQSVTEGSANGTIAVDGTDVKVHGLGTAAYTNSDAYDAAGTAEAMLAEAKEYTDQQILAALSWYTLA